MGREADGVEGRGGDERVVGGVDDQAGGRDLRDERPGAAATVVVLGPVEAVARGRVEVVELVDRAHAVDPRRAQVREPRVQPAHLGAQPADEAPVVDAVRGEPHRPAAAGEVDGRIRRDDAIEASAGVRRPRCLGRQLQRQVRPQRETHDGDRRAGGGIGQAVDDDADVLGLPRVVDPPRQAEARPGPAQVHADDAHAQVQQASGRADDVGGLGRARQPVQEDGRRVAGAPGRRRRIQDEEPVAVGEGERLGPARQVDPVGAEVAPGDRLGVAASEPGMGVERGIRGFRHGT